MQALIIRVNGFGAGPGEFCSATCQGENLTSRLPRSGASSPVCQRSRNDIRSVAPFDRGSSFSVRCGRVAEAAVGRRLPASGGDTGHRRRAPCLSARQRIRRSPRWIYRGSRRVRLRRKHGDTCRRPATLPCRHARRERRKPLPAVRGRDRGDRVNTGRLSLHQSPRAPPSGGGSNRAGEPLFIVPHTKS